MIAVALGKASDFVGIGVLPKVTFAALTEFPEFSKFAGVGIKGVSV